MTVKFLINKEVDFLKVEIIENQKVFEIKYTSDDKDIFEKLNKEIIENIVEIEKVIVEIENGSDKAFRELPKVKVGLEITKTYIDEINKIKDKLQLDNVEKEELPAI